MGKAKGLDSLKPDKNTMLAMYIKEELNKLFYLPPKYDEELEMLKYQYDNEFDERYGVHGSSVSGGKMCLKKEVINIMYMRFKMKGKKVPNKIYKAFKHIEAQENRSTPTHLARIYEEGKSIGTKWQRLFIRGGLGVKEDMDVSRLVDKYDLLYTPDGIIELDGNKYVVEIKSANDNSYTGMKNKHPSGNKQLRLYMHMEGIERGFVLVDNKNTSDFKIFPETNVSEEDKDIKKSIEKLEEIQKAKRKTLKTKKFPQCTCGKCL